MNFITSYSFGFKMFFCFVSLYLLLSFFLFFFSSKHVPSFFFSYIRPYTTVLIKYLTHSTKQTNLSPQLISLSFVCVFFSKKKKEEKLKPLRFKKARENGINILSNALVERNMRTTLAIVFNTWNFLCLKNFIENKND